MSVNVGWTKIYLCKNKQTKKYLKQDVTVQTRLLWAGF